MPEALGGGRDEMVWGGLCQLGRLRQRIWISRIEQLIKRKNKQCINSTHTKPPAHAKRESQIKKKEKQVMHELNAQRIPNP